MKFFEKRVKGRGERDRERGKDLLASSDMFFTQNSEV